MNKISVVEDNGSVRLVPESIDAKALCRRLSDALLRKGCEVFDLDVEGCQLLVVSSQDQEPHRIEINPSVARRLDFILSGRHHIVIEPSRNDDGAFRLYPL